MGEETNEDLGTLTAGVVNTTKLFLGGVEFSAGTTGPAGADGTNGTDGATGATGANGNDGATGPAGPAGADGAGPAAGEGATFIISLGQEGSQNIYVVDGEDRKTIYLLRGKKYIFDQTNSIDHPIALSTVNNGNASKPTTDYTAGWDSSDKTFIVPQDAPDILYYYCTVHPGMGGDIYINSFPQDLLTLDDVALNFKMMSMGA